MKKQVTGEGLLRVGEAASFLGVHPDTLKKRVQEHVIPAVRYNKELRFALGDLEGYKLAGSAPLEAAILAQRKTDARARRKQNDAARAAVKAKSN